MHNIAQMQMLLSAPSVASPITRSSVCICTLSVFIPSCSSSGSMSLHIYFFHYQIFPLSSQACPPNLYQTRSTSFFSGLFAFESVSFLLFALELKLSSSTSLCSCSLHLERYLVIFLDVRVVSLYLSLYSGEVWV